METTDERVKEFCESCGKEKDSDKCVEIDGKTYCCKDCPKEETDGKKKPAICEFC